jgi:hypothetical protein
VTLITSFAAAIAMKGWPGGPSALGSSIVAACGQAGSVQHALWMNLFPALMAVLMWRDHRARV